jgi:hypothetical protein
MWGGSPPQTDGRDFLSMPVEMGSDDIMHIPRFITIGSGIQKLIGQTQRQAGRQRNDLINLLLFFFFFFQNKGRKLIKDLYNAT